MFLFSPKRTAVMTALLMGVSTGFSMAASSSDGSLCKPYSIELLGPRVCVFSPTEEPSAIKGMQDTVTAIHDQQKDNEFGSQGYALLFNPGEYKGRIASNGAYKAFSVPVGFYTQVAGLGMVPDETSIEDVRVAHLRGDTSLTNFWRSAENIFLPHDMVWAVSQASPLRNVHVKGAMILALGDNHYASGGFLANSRVDNGIESRGQQQWINRNVSMGAWFHPGVWNMVFVGNDIKVPLRAGYPNIEVGETASIQEKPYLVYQKESQEFQVIVPDLKTGPSKGADWQMSKSVIPQSQLVIVKPGMTATDIQNALADGTKNNGPKALIFTPGVYALDKEISIDEDNTVVLGLGVPVLSAKKPHQAILRTLAKGIKISGLIFEAGSNEALNENDPSLLEIGSPEMDRGSAERPNLLSDVYCRIGGRVEGQTNSCLSIHDSHVIADNLWLWRADHLGSTLTGWKDAKANHGLIVKGNHVRIYGLAVEHFQKNQVLWEGEHGAVYFYQSELPYDVPEKFVVPASFKVADSVEHFSGYGFGIYEYFRTPSNEAQPDNLGFAESAIEAPDHAGVSFTSMVRVILGKSHSVQHIKSMIRIMPEGRNWAEGPFPKGKLDVAAPFWQGSH